MKLQVSNTNAPAWRNLIVSAEIPQALKPLEEMSKNLWWVWNSKGKNLFRDIDTDLWPSPLKSVSRVYTPLSNSQMSRVTDEV